MHCKNLMRNKIIKQLLHKFAETHYYLSSCSLHRATVSDHCISSDGCVGRDPLSEVKLHTTHWCCGISLHQCIDHFETLCHYLHCSDRRSNFLCRMLLKRAQLHSAISSWTANLAERFLYLCKRPQ